MYAALFDHQDRYLGLAYTNETGILEFSLTDHGKQLLEIERQAWMTRGIPLRDRTVSWDDPDLFSAVESWMREHDLLFIAIPDESCSRIKKIVELPLTPPEIRLFAQLFARTPVADQVAWDQILHGY